MGLSVAVEELKVWREGALDAEPRLVIEALSLEIAAGERVALVGANGAGKTSLLLALVGAAPFEGRIRVGDTSLTKKTLAAVRAELAFVFAEPADQLFSPSVREEVAFAPARRGLARSEIEARVGEALERVGLGGFEERAPSSLSLGEQRRLALAAALSARPALLLLDEPTSGLDGRARRAVLGAMRRTDSTLLVATHDLDAVLELEARAVLLRAGRLLATGPAEELLLDPELLDRAGLELPLGAGRRPAAL